jgi:hypothetical protein
VAESASCCRSNRDTPEQASSVGSFVVGPFVARVPRQIRRLTVGLGSGERCQSGPSHLAIVSSSSFTI